MAVRPFYLSADVEGRRTSLAGGPARHDGSMTVEKSLREMQVRLRQLSR